MSVKEQIIEIDQMRFKLCLNHDDELSFYVEVPKELSVIKTDPLWHTFDEGDVMAYGPEWASDFNEIPKRISIFKLKHKLFDAIVSFVLKHRLKWLWFRATTTQKARIYELMQYDLLAALKHKTNAFWSVQQVGLFFYYKMG